MPSIKKDPPPSRLFVTFVTQKMFFWLRQELRESVCLSVRLSVRHKFVCSSEFSSFFHRSVSGQSQVSLR